jgi:hypothetical protein
LSGARGPAKAMLVGAASAQSRRRRVAIGATACAVRSPAAGEGERRLLGFGRKRF